MESEVEEIDASEGAGEAVPGAAVDASLIRGACCLQMRMFRVSSEGVHVVVANHDQLNLTTLR